MGFYCRFVCCGGKKDKHDDLNKNKPSSSSGWGCCCCLIITCLLLAAGLFVWHHYDWAPFGNDHDDVHHHDGDMGYYDLEPDHGSDNTNEGASAAAAPIDHCPCNPDAYFLDNGRIRCMRPGDPAERDHDGSIVLSLCLWTEQETTDQGVVVATQIQSVDDWLIVLESQSTEENNDNEPSPQVAASSSLASVNSTNLVFNGDDNVSSLRHRDSNDQEGGNLVTTQHILTPIRDGLPNVFTHVRFHSQGQQVMVSTHLAPQLLVQQDREASLHLVDMSVHVTMAATASLEDANVVLKLKQN